MAVTTSIKDYPDYDATDCLCRSHQKIRYIKVEPVEACRIIEDEPGKPAFKTGKNKRKKSWQY